MMTYLFYEINVGHLRSLAYISCNHAILDAGCVPSFSEGTVQAWWSTRPD